MDSTKGRKAQATPDPVHPIAQRLEQVRELNGIANKKEFWRELGYGQMKSDDPEYVSYASVRLWHFNLEPPVKYLRRVSERFGVGLDWLVSGWRTEPLPFPLTADAVAEIFGRRDTRTEDEIFAQYKSKMQPVWDAFPPYQYIERVQDAVLRVRQVWREPLERFDESLKEVFGDIHEHFDAQDVKTLLKVVNLFRLVLDELGVSLDRLQVAQLEQYAIHMAEAIIAVAPRASLHYTLGDLRRTGMTASPDEDRLMLRFPNEYPLIRRQGGGDAEEEAAHD